MDPDVKGLVYVAALHPDVGESGGGLMASVPSGFTSDKLTVFEDGHFSADEDAFIALNGNGLSDKDAMFAAQSQAASNIEILEYEVQAAAWHDKPSWYAIATLDGTVAPELQRQTAERAGSTVVEIESWHMLPMTSPDEVAEIIRQAAETLK